MTWALVPFWFKCVPTQIESARLGNKKSRRGTDHSRIRWRLGWHGGCPATAPWLCVTVFRRLYSGQRTACESCHAACHTPLGMYASGVIKRRSNAALRHVYREPCGSSVSEKLGAPALPPNTLNTLSDQRHSHACEGSASDHGLTSPACNRLIGPGFQSWH